MTLFDLEAPQINDDPWDRYSMDDDPRDEPWEDEYDMYESTWAARGEERLKAENAEHEAQLEAIEALFQHTTIRERMGSYKVKRFR